MAFVTTAALTLALTATGAMAQTNTYDSGKYIELHLILGQGKTRDARIIVFNHGTDEHQTTCARIMGVDLRCFSAAHHADGKWEVALPGVNNTELVDTYSQADALEGKLAVKALAGDLGAADWTAKDAAPVPAQAPREYLSQIQAPPPPPPPPLEPRRVRVFVACGYLTGDNFKSCYLKNYVAKKYPLIEGGVAATGEALKRNGSYRVGLWPQGVVMTCLQTLDVRTWSMTRYCAKSKLQQLVPRKRTSFLTLSSRTTTPLLRCKGRWS